MTLTGYIAELLGIYILLIGALMVARKPAMQELMPRFAEHPAPIYLLGSVRVLIGLAIVLARNVWTGGPGTVVIMIGWVTLLRGVAMLILPIETERKIIGAFKHDPVWYTAAAVAVVLGAGLAYAGFNA